jgi:hypothetical protein
VLWIARTDSPWRDLPAKFGGKAARDLTRQHRLDHSEAPDEFFKLCLDMGLSLDTAESVMRSVKQVR